jgi:hypothetical protein
VELSASNRNVEASFYKALGALILFVLFVTPMHAQITIENAIIRLGRYQAVVTNDMANSAIASPGWTLHPGETFYDYSVAHIDNISIDYNVCSNWTDPDGKVWKYMNIAPFQEGSRGTKFPLKLDDGQYMHNYVRYPQTAVTVNGKLTSSTDPRGTLSPSGIDAHNTTADQYIESSALTNVGLKFTRKIYAWSHFQDNGYVIVEMTVKNVGVGWGPSQKVKLDLKTFKFMIDTVSLPQQTIHDFVFALPKIHPVRYVSQKTLNKNGWMAHSGFTQGDTLRILYSYDGKILAYSYDSIGEPNLSKQGVLQNYMGHFMQLLHADKTWDNTSDDITQPHYTSYAQSWNDGDPKIWADTKTEIMNRWITDPVTIGGPFYSGANIYPVLHQVNMDERGYWVPDNVPMYYPWAHSHAGPYEIPPGKEIRFVFALGTAGLSPEAAFKIGRDWTKGTCTFTGKNSSPLQRPPQATDNDWAKDQWVFTQIDSMRSLASRIQWNADHNFNIPVPPPPLASLTIQEQVGGVKLSWSNNAESFPTFEGYRIYRAMGASDTTIYQLIAELSRSKGNLRSEYIDQDLDRGPDYYYYVSTFSVASGPNAYRKGEILESGVNYVEAFAPTRFVPKQGLASGHWQDSVRVVPNPFNLSAKDVQFSSTPDKMMFVNLPPVCTIRIYSENGNLVKTIEHSDGKSDEQWEQGGQYMLTYGGQRVVSGIYIAHFQTPSGESQFRKFVIVR